MSLSRRGFLTAVLGSTAAALVLPKLDLMAASLPAEQAEIIEGPAWQETLKEIHRQAYACFTDNLERAGRPIKSLHTESKIGQLLPTGEVLAHQWNVGVEQDGVHVPAAMAALTDGVLLYGIDRYGLLPCPAGVAYGANLGPLRMIAQEQPAYGLLLRFDVVGAASEPSFAERRRIDALKVRIRRRISFYQSGRHPVMW